MARALGRGRLTIVANVGDDLEWMGLRVCPDLDSILYSLAGLWDRERGWGIKRETFVVRESLRARGSLAALEWFGIGDRDLALHLARTDLLSTGRTLGAATREIASRLGVADAELVPASDALSATKVRLRDGRALDFQEWYVREAARPAVAEIVHTRGPASPAFLDALGRAQTVVFAPSNPATSIGAILALRGVESAVRKAPRRIAVSPVVVARPSRSPAIAHHARARGAVLRAIGAKDSPASIAKCYAGLVDTFVLDEADRGQAAAIEKLGMSVELTDTLDEVKLARTLRDLVA